MARTVSELGEGGVIELVASFLPAAPAGELWSGDDAAVVAPGANLITTDTMVEGVDFDLGYCDGFDLGWKVTAINVSDIAAMGGTPSRAVATLALPPSTPVELVEETGRGLAAAAREWHLGVVGGDVSSAPQIAIGMTVLGSAAAPVPRTGARPGDLICVTGSVGGSWGGLQLLQRGLRDEAPRLVRRHLRPQARVDEGRRLAELGATAMIDVSDGLAIDLARLMAASGTGCRVDPALVPVDPELRVLVDLGLARGDELLRSAILGGEDFELLATVRGGADVPATVIGEVTEDRTMRFGDEDLEELGRTEGWDHLRGR
jgi:thiamine-monophosphate kinase